MKRTGFKPRGFALRQVKTIEYTPRARLAAVGPDLSARLVQVRPQFTYVRDERLRDMCRAMACQHCGAAGEGAGVTWAHSNWPEHGKGGAIKASDVYVAALCFLCHRMLDQGSSWTKAYKVSMWTTAHAKTVALGVHLGLWPRDVPLPKMHA